MLKKTFCIHPSQLSLQETIRAHYQSMPDISLKQLAKHEMDTLTEEARDLLMLELKKRNISLIEDIVEDAAPANSLFNDNKLDKHIIQYIIEQKLRKESDAYIIGGLFERGYEEPDAVEILSAFPKYLQERKSNMSQFILTGTLQLVSGIAIVELPLSKQTQLAVIIIGYSLLCTGIIRIFHGWLNKKKCDRILDHL